MSEINGKSIVATSQPVEVVNEDAIVCRSCIYCDIVEEKKGMKPGQSWCRINPPTAVPIPTGQHGQIGFLKIFPPVDPDADWCGKHSDLIDPEAIQLQAE